MKKFIYIAAAAVAVAACAKTEVQDLASVYSEVQTPVYFQTAPVTKDDAGATTKTWSNFAQTNVFESAAWYLEKGKAWATDFAAGVNYIPASTVSYMTYSSSTQTTPTSVWRTVQPYYWPKNGGTLTFFSWSLNKSDLNFGQGSSATVEITPEKGVVLTDFNVNVDKGIDFLVADPAYNKTKNEHLYYTDGVPTLFRHKLSSMKITAATEEDYPGKTITIKKITITNVDGEADYQEGENDPTKGWTVIDRWTTDPNSNYDEDLYDGGTSGTKVPTSPSTVTFGGEQTIFIPQDFTGDEMIEITYEIVDEFSGVKEEITVKIPLKEALQTSQGSEDGEFEPGKEYTINLKFTLDLVFWDPAVNDWEVENKGVTVQG